MSATTRQSLACDRELSRESLAGYEEARNGKLNLLRLFDLYDQVKAVYRRAP